MSRRDRQRRRRRNRGSPFGRVLALGAVLIASVLVVGGLAIAGWVVNVAHSAPNLSQVKPVTRGTPSEVFAADGASMGYIYSPDIHTPVSSRTLPLVLKRATVAVEDRRFYHHGALDYQGILRAAIKDAAHGSTALQGASTLTMQLVDNEYLPRKYRAARAQRNLKYKIVQAKLAEQLEAKHSKNWILTGYLNNVPYGTVRHQTAYGAAAASEMFFDKPVGSIDLAQAALLAGLPQAPSEYNPFLYPRAARTRRAHVLQTMVQAGDITQRRADAVARGPLQVKPTATYSRQVDPYVFTDVEQQVAQDLCPNSPRHCSALTNGGLKIYTTIDLHKQAEATAAIKDHESLFAEDGGPGVGSGLASVNSANGDIEAIATSGNYAQTKLDYATSAMRQTGSAFKVFALMELIHDYQGNPDTTYYTSKPLPAGWLPSDPSWSVHTDDNEYNGTLNITNATWLSDNTVFAQLSADMGNTTPGDKLDQMAHAMGITSTLTGNASEVLGGLTYGTTPLQMADAYATISDGGIHHAPTIIDKVVSPDGATRDFGDPRGTRVFSYAESYAADQVLEEVLTHPGATAYGSGYGCPAAGKTGTANNLANAWFVGYSPKVSTAVWVGNPAGDSIGMIDGFGGILAAPVWQQYMQDTHGAYCGDWTPPAVPFVGTPYVGAHSSTREPTTPSSGEGYGNGYGQTTTGTSTTTGTATTTTAGATTATTGSAPTSPPTTGQHGGTGATGGASPTG
jgi:penicillin-binding protein 1A